MLCAKQKSTGEIIEAYFASKSNAPFFCPECGDEVILKVGTEKVNYFAHINPLVCRYDAGESEAHRQCKLEIYHALLQQPNVEKAAMERPLGSNRPDVSAYINGVPVAVEIQISSLSIETLKFRTMEYARKGIYVLWLLLWKPELDHVSYVPRLWEKWVHAAYFGRAYYWISDLTVVSYHFETQLKYVPRKTWYSESGQKMKAGGYARRSKRHRSAIRGRTLNLAADFAPRHRDVWQSNEFAIPPAKIYMQTSQW